MITIHLKETGASFDYLSKIEVESYKIPKSFQGTAIFITYRKKILLLPLTSILVIEE